jgi:hypothetical protein
MSRQRSGIKAEYGGRGRRYDAVERARAVCRTKRLRAEGATWAQVVSATGVSEPTLRRWLEVAGGVDAGAHEGPDPGPAVLPVVVREQTRGGKAGLALVSPSGFRLEGLGLVEALQALRALS